MQERRVRVFLASPGDIEAERQLFYELLPTLNVGAGVRFVPTGYELVRANTGQRPQNLINELVDQCEVFVAVFHRRWGQEAQGAVAATSYTEEEFGRALRRFGEGGQPAIFCFFKNVDLAALADPGPQLTKVLEFRRRLESSGQVLYRTFDSETDFAKELAEHLRGYVAQPNTAERAYRRKVLLPVPSDDGPDTNFARDMAIVRQAALAASVGRIEEAEVMFAKVSQTTVVIPALDVARAFFEEIGNTEAARAVVDRKLAILRDRRLAAQEYVATMQPPGWLDQMIAARLSVTPMEQRKAVEAQLRAAFGRRFDEVMLELLSENLTLGELRALTRFFSGEALTVTHKMTDFMGRVLPPAIEGLVREAMAELDELQ